MKNLCYCQYGLLTDDDLPRPDDDDALLLSLDLLAVGCTNALPRVDARSTEEDALSSMLPIVVMV